jgi:hypothetical protein
MGYDVGRHMAHSLSAGKSERLRPHEGISPEERRQRAQEAVHGGGVHGSGCWTTENALNDWHLSNSIKYKGPFHPEYCETPVPISVSHCGLHDASLDFKTAVRGIVPGYAGHVPRARDMYGGPWSGGITPERGWKRNERTGQMLETTDLGPMGDRAYADGPHGAASRPHAYSRCHNLVSEEVKPGFAGHTPLARDTFGTSPYRDGFTHRTGTSRHRELEDGARSFRTTSSLRFASRSWNQPMSARSLSGSRTSSPRRAASPRSAVSPRSPGLVDRERMSGRPLSARTSLPGGRYFTLSDMPRREPRRVSV